jgi:hypothetical protein
MIDSLPPKKFRDAAEPWQWDCYAPLIPAIESIAGLNPDYTGPHGFWFTLPKGHDKSSFIARVVNWMSIWACRPLRIKVAAADEDQARIIRNHGEIEAHLNPWFGEFLTIERRFITGPTAETEILSSDAATSSGLIYDVAIADEIWAWKKEDLWTILFGGRIKRPGAIFIVITNAGFLGTWQREKFEAICQDDSWYVYEAPGYLANWTNKDQLEKDKKLLIPSEVRRLFDNIWSSSSENSVFSAELLDRVSTSGGWFDGPSYEEWAALR